MSRYLAFERYAPPARKTPVIRVSSKRNGALLGVIAWYGAWRQFAFYPEPSCVFNVECMTDIQSQIAALAEERLSNVSQHPGGVRGNPTA